MSQTRYYTDSPAEDELKKDKCYVHQYNTGFILTEQLNVASDPCSNIGIILSGE